MMNNEIIYDDYQEKHLSIKIIPLISLLVGFTFILIGVLPIILNWEIFRSLILQISGILCGAFIIITSIWRIINWQNLRIDEKGIFPYERTLSDILNKKGKYIKFKNIEKIIETKESFFTKGVLILHIKKENIIKINKNNIMNLKKFLRIMYKKINDNNIYYIKR